jgi:Spy/CpxP family protein refolding chaperone
MKTKHLISATIIALMLLGTSSLFAQHDGPGFCNDSGLKLTDDQKAKIKEIHMASYKEMKELQNQMGELKAKQRTLTTADKTDMNAINANIDEISKVMNKMMKIRAANHQQVRNLLTDEQKMLFDSKAMQRHFKNKMRMHKEGHEFRGGAEHLDDSPQS